MSLHLPYWGKAKGQPLVRKCGIRNLHLLGFFTKAVRLWTATIAQKVVVWLTRTLGHKAYYTLVKTYLFWALNSFYFYKEFYYHNYSNRLQNCPVSKTEDLATKPED